MYEGLSRSAKEIRALQDFCTAGAVKRTAQSPAAFLCLKDEEVRPRIWRRPICETILTAGGCLLYFLCEGLGPKNWF